MALQSALIAVLMTVMAAEESEPLDFGRDVRPILADNCFACHGPDASKRQAGLRLDRREAATAQSVESGNVAIVPGKPEQSELVKRIQSRHGDMMPPPDSLKRLTADQKQTLIRWIAAGAEYKPHWSFVTPRKTPVPTIDMRNDTHSPLDQFVVAKWFPQQEESPEADRATLLRRVTLDLTGLPPSLDALIDFESDSRPDAFERVVDRLLASPRYGEHMARDWLDAARYADTHGYFTDHERFMWRWRDWVINAFNRNLPFDQFTIEQLAGDLLPSPTTDQLIATGFNRNHMITEETGVTPEEYRTEYVADRVRTTSAIWLGLTAGCAQCHDHKYDPITQREFFQLFAYFNNLPEAGIAGGKQKNAAPELRLPSPEQTFRLGELAQELVSLERELAALDPSTTSALRPLMEARRTVLRDAEKTTLAQVPTTMIMQDQTQTRDTFILVRGQYDQPGEKVTPGVPSFLPPVSDHDPQNRLALVRWLVNPQHPLTARVAVNRLWRQLFGRGIVSTVEDFGLQGDFPSHPELLDWLAVEFAVGASHSDPDLSPTNPLRWDVKRLQRLIVSSSTYRQSSALTPDGLRSDAANRRLGRAPRYRLDAEAIRDSALFAAGLLTERLGGPSVKPYQPDGLWKSIVYDTKSEQFYDVTRGEGLYRRSLYTYWKRQVPHPSMLQLDAPTREVCVLRRQRTNTPLQALVLMNDPQFVEAARVLAQRTIESSPNDTTRLDIAFRRVISRVPTATERTTLLKLLAAERKRFLSDSTSAAKLLQVGDSPLETSASLAEVAAWTVVTTTILNLDEAITRE